MQRHVRDQKSSMAAICAKRLYLVVGPRESKRAENRIISCCFMIGREHAHSGVIPQAQVLAARAKILACAASSAGARRERRPLNRWVARLLALIRAAIFAPESGLKRLRQFKVAICIGRAGSWRRRRRWGRRHRSGRPARHAAPIKPASALRSVFLQACHGARPGAAATRAGPHAHLSHHAHDTLHGVRVRHHLLCHLHRPGSTSCRTQIARPALRYLSAISRMAGLLTSPASDGGTMGGAPPAPMPGPAAAPAPPPPPPAPPPPPPRPSLARALASPSLCSWDEPSSSTARAYAPRLFVVAELEVREAEPSSATWHNRPPARWRSYMHRPHLVVLQVDSAAPR